MEKFKVIKLLVGTCIEDAVVTYLGFKRIEYSEFEDDFKGVFTFKTICPSDELEFDVFNLFCLELQ